MPDPDGIRLKKVWASLGGRYINTIWATQWDFIKGPYKCILMVLLKSLFPGV